MSERQPTAPAPVRVLYVGGMPRSGSTLLTWMLGNLDGHVAVGELFYLWSAGLQRDQLCGCGAVFSACPFWTDVGKEAFEGWSNVDAEHMAELATEVDDTRQLLNIMVTRISPRFTARKREYVASLARVYSAVAKVSGCDTVVDGSKRPSLAFLLRFDPSIDLRVVHVVRDPRGVVHSWSKQVPLPAGASSRGFLKARSARLITRRWLTVNVLFVLLRRMGVPTDVVNYEDLAAEPRATLHRLANSSGLAASPDPVAFVAPDGVHLRRAHMVEGGRVRFTELPLRMRLDESWRHEMPLRTRRLVGAATWSVRRLLGLR